MSRIIATAEVENNGKKYESVVHSGTHELITDEPPENGGENKGPAPGDFLCMALASCTAITLRMYADRKNWKADNIKVKVNLVKSTDTPTGVNTYYCEVTLTGELQEDQKKRMQEIAKACPIHRLLLKPAEVVTIIT